MATPIPKILIFALFCVTYTRAFDDIDLELQYGTMGKLLRVRHWSHRERANYELSAITRDKRYSLPCKQKRDKYYSWAMSYNVKAMENQTKADTLNLPANASSIRENITDTFSCENRTYGYYADVDNDCQLFHVCLPTQTASGRSITFRWSFICPNETVFNQEVLVCTRPRDAIDCADSPNYYDLNMEIGKETNDTKSESNDKDNTNMENFNTDANKNSENMNQQAAKERNRERIKQQKRKQVNRRKQNLIAQNHLQNTIKQVKKEDLAEKNIEIPFVNPDLIEFVPKIEAVDDDGPVTITVEDFENARLFAERSLKMKSRKRKRGLFRFKADV